MPSRLREALDDLQREVADLTLEPPSAVRARGDALRHRRAAGVAISTALAAAAAGAIAVPILRPSPTTSVPGSAPTTCATAWEQPDEASLALSTHVRVFLAMDASPEQIELVRQSLTELGLSTEFVGRAQAFEEFKEYYACEPDLIRYTRAENLPESFDVTLHEPAQYHHVRATLTGMPGVELVHRMPQ